MADAKPPTPPEAPTPSSAVSSSSTASTTSTTATTTTPPPPQAGAAASVAEGYKAPKPNPVWQMLGLRGPPKRLPSRNWMIFLSLASAFSAVVIYDKREKKRATARWARAVVPLAQEPVADPSQLPRKLTVILEAPPGDGLRVAQDHFREYVKPVLAASGLDWEFVQGREEGDVRAAIAAKIRRRRSLEERPDVELLPTEENVRDAVRKKNAIPEFDGPAGDIVIGRHTWKEYIRGLHEGWLGPLDPPETDTTTTTTTAETTTATSSSSAAAADDQGEEKKKEEPEEEKKPARPPQPVPYNTTADYPTSHLPLMIPSEFAPSEPIPFPHLLGFAGTFTRMHRFLNRRHLADDIGRQVAAVCFAASAREWRDDTAQNPDQPYEQQRALEHEESDWVKAVWKTTDNNDGEGEEKSKGASPVARDAAKERVWASPIVIDPRIADRMRRLELRPEDEERARQIVIPEAEIEGWIKGSLRSLGRWGWQVVKGPERKGPNVGNLDDE